MRSSRLDETVIINQSGVRGSMHLLVYKDFVASSETRPDFIPSTGCIRWRCFLKDICVSNQVVYIPKGLYSVFYVCKQRTKLTSGIKNNVIIIIFKYKNCNFLIIHILGKDTVCV